LKSFLIAISSSKIMEIKKMVNERFFGSLSLVKMSLKALPNAVYLHDNKNLLDNFSHNGISSLEQVVFKHLFYIFIYNPMIRMHFQ